MTAFDGRFLNDPRIYKECAGCFKHEKCLPVKIGSIIIGYLCGECYREFEELVQYGQRTLDECLETCPSCKKLVSVNPKARRVLCPHCKTVFLRYQYQKTLVD